MMYYDTVLHITNHKGKLYSKTFYSMRDMF